MDLNHICNCGNNNWEIDVDKINKNIVSDGVNIFNERNNSCILDMIICFDCEISCNICNQKFLAILPTKYFPHKKWENTTFHIT